MKTRDLTLISMFIVLIIVGTFIRIPLPLCPINLQPFFVILAGLLLGGKRGAASVGGFVLLGLIGVPVFTNGGGIGYVLQPTFGYMLGYCIGAFLAGCISSGENPSVLRFAVAGLCGLMVVYIVGVAYFWCISRYYLNTELGIQAMLVSCFLIPFPKDVVSCVLAAFLAKRLLPIINLDQGGYRNDEYDNARRRNNWWKTSEQKR